MSRTPYEPWMTHAPVTEAYLARMKRRDDPNDYGICEHNVDPAQCRDCERGCRAPYPEFVPTAVLQ